MNYNDYLNGYEKALKMPQKEFHAYCMEMREAAPMEVAVALQENYRMLLLAVKQQAMKDAEKEAALCEQ